MKEQGTLDEYLRKETTVVTIVHCEKCKEILSFKENKSGRYKCDCGTEIFSSPRATKLIVILCQECGGNFATTFIDGKTNYQCYCGGDIFVPPTKNTKRTIDDPWDGK